MLVNTEYFREAARHFEKHGKYDDGVFGSTHWREYWRREAARCLNGYSVGGLRIPGYYYHYLNYGRMKKVEVKDDPYTKHLRNARRKGKRKPGFPDFWDVDLMFFTAFDIAENGMSKEEFENINKFISLPVREQDLSGGKHLVWLKARGVGASFKAGNMCERNYSLIPSEASYIIAKESAFLDEDGTWNKFLDSREWINSNALGFARRSDRKNDAGNMHVKASYMMDDIEKGFLSEVIGVTLGNNIQRARGKRGRLIVWEEFGAFKDGQRAWEIARPSVEEEDVNFGTMLAMGTGGTEEADFEALRALFYNPTDYNCLCFDNIYDENMSGTFCGFFTPAYMSVGLKDKDGNSDIERAKELQSKERERAAKSSDAQLLPRKKAEKPWTPQEAILNTNRNVFMSEILLEHKNYVQNSNLYHDMALVGTLNKGDNGRANFYLDANLKPIHKFPHKGEYDNLHGGVVLYEKPYVDANGNTPKDLYIIDVDPFRHSTDDVQNTSIGSIYVTMNKNNFTRDGGDKIVAWYNGRPEGHNSQEEFNNILFLLADLYNAKIAFENDEPGDIVGYAKRKKLIHRLEPEFELAYNDNLKNSKVRRGFGMHMSSGKNNERKRQGDLYLKSWLYTVRYTDASGKEYLNLHFIYDLGLLQELCSYNDDGNFDRISAMRIKAYHDQELLYNERIPKGNKVNRSPKSKFFRRSKFNAA